MRSAKGGEAMLVLGASVSRPLPLPPNLKRLVDARFEVCTCACVCVGQWVVTKAEEMRRAGDK